MRKESGFEITDRINLEVSGDAELKDAFVQFRDFIAGETLAASAEWKDSVSGGFTAEADDKTWTAKISKVEG
ncbi:MAG: hypothetical protein ILP07_04635 [Treponema sp.]|nr:hypothetical protein [Treponema sp.]